MKDIFILICLQTLFNFNAKSQNEFLARVDPSDISFSTFDSIPGVHWVLVNSATLDENNHQFFFVGAPPNNTPSYLYTLNSLTGKIVSNPLLPSNELITSQFIGLEYDNNSDTLYGMFHENYSQKWRFSWIDHTNGFVHVKDSMPSQWFAIGSSTYDKNHHRYFYYDGMNTNVIDAHTGKVLYSYVPSHAFINGKYDNANDRLYGLSNPNCSTIWEFDSMEVATGILHHISTVPCQYIVTLPIYKALDEKNGRYFFVGVNASNYFFYSIDIATGNILSDPGFSLFGDSNNLIEFVYDNILDTLFSLHWGSSNISAIPKINIDLSTLCINPNPSSGEFSITQNISTNAEIEIQNIFGELVYKNQFTNQQMTIDLSNRPKGVYFIIASLNSKNLITKKIIIQ